MAHKRAAAHIIDIDVYYITDSPRAVCVTDGSTHVNVFNLPVMNRYWLAKSLVDFEISGDWQVLRPEGVKVMDCIVTLPEWLAVEKGLEGSVKS